ncbi:MAG: hypothetical protein KDE27_14940, partial [Planctomycetes bacterium]|nr:hypothetical protein [Planctomycetota bacterium]
MKSVPNGRGGRPSPKTLQLCRQVFDALTFALGETTDPILLDLVLERVEPLHADRDLLVVVQDPARHGQVATL